MFKRKLFNDEQSVEVSLTPLIDTVFVLLIIFIIMAVGKKDSMIDVSLPQATSVVSHIKGKKYFLVALDQYKNIFISGKKKIDLVELKKIIKEYCQEEKKFPQAILYADKDLFFGEVISVMDVLRNFGIEKIYLEIKKID